MRCSARGAGDPPWTVFLKLHSSQQQQNKATQARARSLVRPWKCLVTHKHWDWCTRGMDHRGLLGSVTGPQMIPYTSPGADTGHCLLFDAGIADSVRKPFFTSMSQTKRPEWTAAVHQELLHQMASSFDVWAKAFTQSQPQFHQTSPRWQTEASASPIICPPLTLTSMCSLVQFNVESKLSWQDIEAKETHSELRNSLEYFLSTYCTENASSFMHPTNQQPNFL